MKHSFYGSSLASHADSTQDRPSKEYKEFFAAVNAAYDMHSATLIAELKAAEEGKKPEKKKGGKAPKLVSRSRGATSTTTPLHQSSGYSSEGEIEELEIEKPSIVSKKKAKEKKEVDPAEKARKIALAKEAACIKFETAMQEVVFEGIHEIIRDVPMFVGKSMNVGQYLYHIQEEEDLGKTYSIADFASSEANKTLGAIVWNDYAKLVMRANNIPEDEYKDNIGNKQTVRDTKVFEEKISGLFSSAQAVLDRFKSVSDKIKETSRGIKDQLERDAKPQTSSLLTFRKGLSICALGAFQVVSIYATQNTDKLRLASYAATGVGALITVVPYFFTSVAKGFNNDNFKRHLESGLRSSIAGGYRNNFGGIEEVVTNFISLQPTNVFAKHLVDVEKHGKHTKRLEEANKEAEVIGATFLF